MEIKIPALRADFQNLSDFSTVHIFAFGNIPNTVPDRKLFNAFQLKPSLNEK